MLSLPAPLRYVYRFISVLTPLCQMPDEGWAFWLKSSLLKHLITTRRSPARCGHTFAVTDAMFLLRTIVLLLMLVLGATAGTTVVLDATQYPGSNAGDRIAAAYRDLPNDGGVVDARGFRGANFVLDDPFENGRKPVTILLGPVTLNLSRTITLPSNSALLGISGQTIVTGAPERGTTWGSRFIVITGSNVVVRDIVIDDPDHQSTQGIAIMNGARDVVIAGVVVRGVQQYGIVVGDLGVNGGSDNIRIIDNRIEDIGDSAANPIGIEYFPRGGPGFLSRGLLIEGNYVRMRPLASAPTGSSGIKVNAAEGARILNNYVDGQHTTNSGVDGGIVVVASRNARIAGNVVRRVRRGINTSGWQNPDNGLRNEGITVESNTVSEVGAQAMVTTDGVGLLVIRGNQFMEAKGGAARGVYLLAGTQAFSAPVVYGNFISGFSIAGIECTSCERAVIDTNQLDTGRITIIGDDALITDNVLWRSRSYGIHVAGRRAKIARNTVVDANTQNSSSQAGINVLGTHATITDNHIENTETGVGHAKYGIFLNRSASSVVRNNIIRGMEVAPFFDSNPIGPHSAFITESALGEPLRPFARIDVGQIGSVQSRLVVTNLNADLLDGYDSSPESRPETLALRTSEGVLAAQQFRSSAMPGQAPLVVESTTPVANLTLAHESQLPVITQLGKVAGSAVPLPTLETRGGVYASTCADGQFAIGISSSGQLECNDLPAQLVLVPYAQTLVFDAARGTSFRVDLLGDVASSQLISAKPGQLLTIQICQDDAGGRTFAWPANFRAAMAITASDPTSSAGRCSVQTFMFDGNAAYATSPGVINQ